jgi:Major Facilitator Superfamily
MHWLNPDQLPHVTSDVERFLLNPHGDADGLTLTNGIEVHFPPHLSGEILAAVRPGDRVSIYGVQPRTTTMIAAVAIETAEGKRIVDKGPPKLALTHAGEGAALMSACIIAAQVVMVPIAVWVARKAQTWGGRPLFLAALGILPIRGVLYTLSDDRFWLVSVQLLDGIGAGILGVLTPLMLADLMHGTGRYNASQGIVATVQGISVAISNAVVGFIVVRAGYDAAFITLAAIASLALLIFLFIVPETRRESLPNIVIPHRTAARRLL